MPKRYRNLYPQIHTFENLLLASRKARLGKRQRLSTAEFEYDLEKNLFGIQEELAERRYQFGEYRHFTIHEPQERQIAAAPYRDRVVHHALCNIIEPILDRAMIEDSYACRIGKGLHRALNRAQKFIDHYPWALKIDFRKYFFTIDHATLLSALERKFQDPDIMLLIRQILATHCSPPAYYPLISNADSAPENRPMGLPIGNLTSQIFANYFLTPIDRLIKQELHIKGYLRYMDDGLIFGRSKVQLNAILADIRQIAEDRLLCLHPRKCQVFPVKNGLPFLGFRLYPGFRRVATPNLQRFKKRLSKQHYLLAKGEIDREHIVQSLNAWLGFAGAAPFGPLPNRSLRLRSLRLRSLRLRSESECISAPGFGSLRQAQGKPQPAEPSLPERSPTAG